jgi:phosphatidylserine/phosphatidylglycerophosphate/cardiolipin synthase-like enzyme
MSGAIGLTRVALPALEQLAVAIDGGRLSFPFGEADLADVGFHGPGADVVDALGALSPGAALEVLRAVIAERVHRPPPRIQLVWTGPETKASVARSTALVVEEMFASARESVIVGGYSFDDPEILRPLHCTMVERNVSATLFLDIPGEAPTRAGADAFAFASAYIDSFFRSVWVFGSPKPDVYYDPRTAMPGPPWASLHAKCIVVDDARALITSANFTDRGHSRNVEAGVLIEDRTFAEELAAQWRQLVGEGLMHKYSG